MKNLSLVVAALLLSAIPAFAQRTAYSIDNFDFRNGVQAAAPAIEVSKPLTGKAGRSRTRPAVAASTSPSIMPSSSLVSPTLFTPNVSATASIANLSALRGYTTGSSEVDGYLVKSGTSNSVDPLLLYSVMHQESS